MPATLHGEIDYSRVGLGYVHGAVLSSSLMQMALKAGRMIRNLMDCKPRYASLRNGLRLSIEISPPKATWTGGAVGRVSTEGMFVERQEKSLHEPSGWRLAKDVDVDHV